jgi:hypothetical protein
VTVRDGADVLNPRPGDGHAALFSGRRQQRAGGSAPDPWTARIPWLLECGVDSPRDVAHRTDPAEQRIGGLPGQGWWRDGEGAPNRRRGVVDEGSENRQAADPVGESVLHHEDERDSAVGQRGDNRGVPGVGGPSAADASPAWQRRPAVPSHHPAKGK